MPTELLQTKLSLPLLRKDLVPRAHLFERLNHGLLRGGSFERRLTLVAAPAGYGKTTLVVNWLQEQPSRVAWLSLEENDNDPSRFLIYLIAAIRQVQTGFGGQIEGMLRSPQPLPADIILTALNNELASVATPFFLVLDDYHCIHNQTIHQYLTFLLDHAPACLNIVITTREDPLLPVARLRARGQILEMRQEELRFNQSEISDFLRRVMRLDLTEEEIVALEQRTEGWIAGLQLAAISMRGLSDMDAFIRAFTGSSRYIFDYLIEEVFRRQPLDIQEFLVNTSILPRLSGPLCDAITGRKDSQEMLEHLEQANLFIQPLDQSRAWFRYHRLFADLLRRRLGMNAVLEKELHNLASKWFEVNDYLTEAVEQALTANAWERVSVLIARVSPSLINRGEISTLVGWFQRTPMEILQNDPLFGFEFCWPLLLTGRFEEASPLLNHAEQIAQDQPEFLGQVLAAQAYHARGVGNHDRMIANSEQALRLLPAKATDSRDLVALNLGIAYWHMGRIGDAEKALAEILISRSVPASPYALLSALIFQGRALVVRGELRRAKPYFEQAINQGGRATINALAYLDLAGLYYEWNDLETSREYIQQAISLAEQGRNLEFQLGSWMLLVRLEIARGNHEAASIALEKVRYFIQTGEIPSPTAIRVPPLEVFFALAHRDLVGAHRWESQLLEHVDAHTFCRFQNLTLAQLMIARRQLSEAETYLTRLYETATKADRGYCRIAIRVLQALAAHTHENALAFLSDALNLAGDQGFLRVFVDAGLGLIPLLQEAAHRGTQPDQVGQILAALGKKQATVGNNPPALVEPLSERETEVLRLIRAGLSNREIAAKLVISLGTAKTHVHNICGKLEVRNRTEAATRASELNLI